MKNFLKNTYAQIAMAGMALAFIFCAIAYSSGWTITDNTHQPAAIITPSQATSMTSAKDHQKLIELENYLVSAVNTSIKRNYDGKSFNVKVQYKGLFLKNVMPAACKNCSAFSDYCYVNFSAKMRHEAAHMLIAELKTSGWYVNKNPIFGRNYLYMRVSSKPMGPSIIVFTGR